LPEERKPGSGRLACNALKQSRERNFLAIS